MGFTPRQEEGGQASLFLLLRSRFLLSLSLDVDLTVSARAYVRTDRLKGRARPD